MSEDQRYIVVRNWERFQHKDIWRKSKGVPPWIKIYTALLYDDDYMQLSPRLRGLLHGIWLLYAASGGVVPASPSYISRTLGLESEWMARVRRERGESVAREGREFGEGAVRSRDLKALEQAGFIELKSRPPRYTVAPREEKRRIDLSTKDVSGENGREKSARGSAWVDNLNSYTGCRYIRGSHATSAVRDPLGTEPPPRDWPHPRPMRDEILKALENAALTPESGE